MEQRANIKFCFKLGKTFTETFELMKKVYGDDCLSRTRVFEWYKRFQDGRDALEDDPKPGRPKNKNRDELVEKVREMIAYDANSTVRWIAEELNTTKDMIHEILTKDLNKRKVCARFVPHALNEDQEIARVEHCKDLIKTARRNCTFLESIVTGDETWCFKYDPQTKRQSATWKSPGSPKSKKLRFQKSREKTMLICFYDSKGIILREFVPQGQNVTGEYYLGVMERLWKRIVRVRPEYRAPGSWFLLHDNAPSHRTVAVREFLAKKQVCVLQHPPYSPDLSPCDYFLFPKLKLAMKGTFYDNVTQVQEAVTRVIEAIPKNDIKKSMLALVERAQRCIDAEGMYFE